MQQSTQQIIQHLCLWHTECSSNYEISAPTTYQMIRKMVNPFVYYNHSVSLSGVLTKLR